MCSRSVREASSTACLVRGQGTASNVIRRAVDHVDVAALRGQRAAAVAGLAGAELDDRHDRGAGDQREVGRAAVEPVELAGTAGALGEDPDRSPVAQHAQAGLDGRRVGVEPVERDLARPSAGSGPSCPRTSPSWSARAPAAGAKIASSGPSATPTWLQAKITGPVRGHVLGAVHASRRTRRRITNRAERAQRAQQEPGGCLAALAAAACGRAGRVTGCSPRLARLDQRDDRLDRPRPGCTRGVDVDGAVGHHQRRDGPAGVDPVAGEQRLAGRVDVGSRPPRRPGARRGRPGRRTGRP